MKPVDDYWRWAIWGLRHVTSMLDELNASELRPSPEALEYLEEHHRIVSAVLGKQRDRKPREAL